MTYIQKFTLGIIFTFFSINMLGCSGGGGGETTVIKTPPTIQISPALDFDFGTVTEGNIASPLEVVITNIGSERLEIDGGISLSDTFNFDLNAEGGAKPCFNLSTALPAGESCTVEITFTPGTFPADLSTELTINSSNAPNKTLVVTGTSEQVNKLIVTINQVDTAACPDFVAYVSVTDQESFPIDNLSEANFTIEEDDIPIGEPTGSTVGNATTYEPISIAIVMDNSSSMKDIDIAEMNQAAIEVVESLNTDDQAEIIKFNKVASVAQTFTSDPELLKSAIIETQRVDGTALYDALQLAIDDASDPLITGRKAIIVITDGADTDSDAKLVDIKTAAISNDIPIFVIALGGDLTDNTINNVLMPVANDTSGAYYQADVAQNLRTIIEQQLTEILFTDQYILSYSGSGNDVTLTISVDNLTGLTGTTGSKPVPACSL